MSLEMWFGQTHAGKDSSASSYRKPGKGAFSLSLAPLRNIKVFWIVHFEGQISRSDGVVLLISCSSVSGNL